MPVPHFNDILINKKAVSKVTGKKELSERDIITKRILPHIVKTGWDIETQIREEVSFSIISAP
ncbi:hypothetical protein AGMMS50230_18900 [Spirochaetia bacterium]|nr:hypothetical protein AGMMS50230_18900 [Spirochaetia bacterium]